MINFGNNFVQLSSVHPSNDTRIFYKICKSLVNAGYSVDLIIQHSKNEIREGVNIIALPIAKKKSDRVFKVIPKLLKLSLQYPKGTVFHFHDPELIPIGLVLKLWGYKVIYDVHEDVPKDLLTKDWIPSLLRKVVSFFVGKIESLGAFFFDSTIVVTKEIQKRFIKYDPILVQNFPILQEEKGKNITDIESTNSVFYLGDITLIRGLKEVVKALELVNEKREVKLLLGGKFSPPSFKQELEIESGWKNVDFVGWINRDQMSVEASKASVGIVTFHPVPNHLEAQPNKLFEYMFLKLPVIASNFPLWEEIIHDCGILVDPLSPSEIAQAINWILENPQKAKEMGERGRKLVIEKYNWQKEELKLLELYQKLCSA